MTQYTVTNAAGGVILRTEQRERAMDTARKCGGLVSGPFFLAAGDKLAMDATPPHLHATRIREAYLKGKAAGRQAMASQMARDQMREQDDDYNGMVGMSNYGEPAELDEDKSSGDQDDPVERLAAVLVAAGISEDVIDRALAAVKGMNGHDAEQDLIDAPPRKKLGSKGASVAGEDDDEEEDGEENVERRGREQTFRGPSGREVVSKDDPDFAGAPHPGGSMQPLARERHGMDARMRKFVKSFPGIQPVRQDYGPSVSDADPRKLTPKQFRRKLATDQRRSPTDAADFAARFPTVRLVKQA